MSLALDYMGKLVIVLLVVGVVISMLIGFEDQIGEGIPLIEEEREDSGEDIVEVSETSELANMIDICVSETVDNIRDETCFILRHPEDSYDTTKDEIETYLESDAESVILDDSYEREIITVNYDISEDAVVVEE